MGVVVAAVAALTITEVATAVAVTGLALSVAGAVTHDKTLSTIGMVMGFAGGAVGLGAGLMGASGMAVGEAADLGSSAVSDFLGGGAAASDATAGVGEASAGLGEAGTAAQGTLPAAEAANSASTPGAVNPVNGWENPPPIDAAKQGAVGAIPQTDLAASPSTASQLSQTPTPGVSTAGSSPSSELSLAQQTTAANAGPGAPTVNPDGSMGSLGPSTQANQLSTQTAMNGAPAYTPGDPQGWWAKLDPNMKTMLALSGGQALAGAAGGLFQSMSASDRLELDKLMNEQRQGQVQLTNQRGAYAPRVSFNSPVGPAGSTGTLGMAGRPMS